VLYGDVRDKIPCGGEPHIFPKFYEVFGMGLRSLMAKGVLYRCMEFNIQVRSF